MSQLQDKMYRLQEAMINLRRNGGPQDKYLGFVVDAAVSAIEELAQRISGGNAAVNPAPNAPVQTIAGVGVKTGPTGGKSPNAIGVPPRKPRAVLTDA